ncbi:Ubiquitin carboxyl-terminal hydrolase 26 [Apostasia shenzhenica]|uniref:Ubiquitin carboxyl-terminal hydrolase 26 n=1 Tax=Apostasia shenzhenica TaxID=1088818 RepID=A0A2I0A7T7_9ASPA|nr:Ubiquitin carboxyl-terminal hydrolase 26 [Apostasia shenzhenica]
MSKPGTRSKNKRQRTDDSDDSSCEILRKVHATGEISHDDICQLYLIWKPVCQGCRVNSKDSPNCFCGLIPPPNGTRKTGLWQRMPEIIESLGPNPCKDHRTSTDTPAGLTNLGATCYANSILQCLYMNPAFREGIFSVEPELLKYHPVLDQLARLFAQLHSSKRAFIDSAPFIKTLELDNGVQQDSHEFLTLFLSLLERSLSHSKVPNARTIVQDLFRGNVSHVTRCSICGKESDASSKMEDFYELELNIKGFSHLDESFDDYLNLEELHGENQYFCESCGTRVDATRSIKLRSLPSVLNLQLKRYVFLPKTTTKKKITSSFSFPRLLNMEKRLCSPYDADLIYELSAILIHKGPAVNSGHYVAHIKDEKSGHWWEFDDEHVSKLGFPSFGDSSKVDLTIQSDGQTMQSLANGGNNAINHTQGEIYSSTDAYMLMYTSVNKNRKIINSTKKIAIVDSNVEAINTPLPLHFYEEIEELNSLYEKDCEEYQSRKDAYLSNIKERREEVKQMLSEAPVQSPVESFFWISAEWLRQWADSVTPSSIDNSPIQCSHGKAPFSKVTSMKRLSATAWQRVFTKYEGGPTLTSDDFCIDCLKGAAENAVSSDDYREKRALLRELAEASLTGNHPDSGAYYVSRPWLLHWLRRKNVDSPCEADAGPTAALTCPHGDLLPEQATGAKRVLVPEVLWKFFHECASKVKPDDLLGSMVFPAYTEPCETCSRELTEVACLEDTLRAEKLRQRHNHEKLIMGKSFPLHDGCKYFLIPSSWLAQWRAYVATTGKNISSSIAPENLEVIMNSLICKQHSRLLERPLQLLCKRGIISQKVSNTDGLTLISESDWKLFCEEWKVPESKGILAEIAICTNRNGGSCEKKPIMVELDHLKEETNDELEEINPLIRTHPMMCEDCIGERESSELLRKLNYCNEDICVHLVRGKEAPRSVIEASTAAPGRSSKRSKKTSYGNSVNFKVSGTTSIYQLKMMIWEAFGVVKENQKLHKGSAEIEGDSATLADKNIFPGDTLWVMDTEIYENRDIADELSESKMEPPLAEEGFRGTLLTSDVPVQGFQEKPSEEKPSL